ncbi:hypothetical protein BGZ90_003314, partial [Linnemannia elongata]
DHPLEFHGFQTWAGHEDQVEARRIRVPASVVVPAQSPKIRTLSDHPQFKSRSNLNFNMTARNLQLQ